VRRATFFRTFVAEFFEAQLQSGLLTSNKFNDALGRLGASRFKLVAEKLFARSPRSVNVPPYGPLRILQLRELDGSTFPFLQGLEKTTRQETLTCFIGHRFLPQIEKDLRYNLAQILSPYNIRLRWSGYDLSAAGLFGDIVDGIRNADMCFFDNLGTLHRPNVYIEIGVAHALGKPMIVSEYVGPTRRNAKRIPDSGSVPSDLQGLVRIAYSSYEELCKRIYFGLPMFFERNRLVRG